MKEHSLIPILKEFADPIALSLGVTIWGIRIVRAKDTVIQFFIDTEDGASIDDCTAFSRSLGAELDILDSEDVRWEAITSLPSYTLEVSTPGVERQFFYISQLEAYIGKVVNLLLEQPLQSNLQQRRYEGKLLSLQEDTIVILPEGFTEGIQILWKNIDRIRLVYFSKSDSTE